MANYNETPDGDLSSNSASPTLLALSLGSNVVTGSTTSSPLDRDFFTFVVPVGSTVKDIILQNYSGASNSYFAVTKGGSFPSLTDATTFEVSKLVDTDEIGKDLLDSSVGTTTGSPAGTGGQLGAGTYSVWYQETGTNTTYAFDVKLDTLSPSSPGQIQFSSNAVQVNEAAGTVDLTLTRTGGSTGAVSAVLNQTGGTAQKSLDYTIATPLTVNFADGETQKVVSVAIVNDTLVEGNETALFGLTNPTGGATLGTTVNTTLTIADDDKVSGGTDNPDILSGGVGNDIILGLGGNDRLSGNEGDDFLAGGGGNDRLFGNAGVDRLWGGGGDDLLDGGAGADILVGGTGRDTFVLRRRDGSDFIRDFQIGKDVLDLRGNLSFGQLTIAQDGTKTLISSGSNVLATLKGVQADKLTAAQFH